MDETGDRKELNQMNLSFSLELLSANRCNGVSPGINKQDKKGETQEPQNQKVVCVFV
jgi:hypothetical protein